MAVTGTTLRVDNLRGYAQREIFLLEKADNPSAASAVSAMTCVICAASAYGP